MTLHLVYEKAWVPSTRIRLRQLVPRLESAGWPCRVAAYPRSARERDGFADGVGPEDVVLVHRARPTRREARWWSALPAPIVYDFDDAIMWGRRRGLRGRLERRRRAAGFRRMLQLCDGASCGNAFLAEQCRELRGPVAIVPSAVRGDVPQAPLRDAAPLRVGWVGRRGNLASLRPLCAVLARVAAARDVRLVVLCDASIELPGVRVIHRRWSLESEAAEVAGFDVGLMPLELEHPWSRGKCAYKLLQYMAAGVPALGSDVGMNRDLIRHGENGLLARTADDWERSLLALADDPTLRRRLGRAGRETVLAGYTIEAIGDRLAALLAEVARAAGHSKGSIRSTADATSKT
jgi:glycosyltransferase involved in cell wall biosynthesis